MSRKTSLVANFSALSNSTLVPHPPIQRVSAGVVGAAQRSLTEIRDERDRLAKQVAIGGWLEIDPTLVDPSPFPDRMEDDDPSVFETFKQSIAQEGQKIPVQVRRHPTEDGRYQIIYGNRRCRAARDLKIALRAFVVEISDHDMIVVQGIENSARQDLTWIEKALFSNRMAAVGVKARDIRAALHVADSELARFRSVVEALGTEVLGVIGRAPKIGRDRWMALSRLATTAGDSHSRIVQNLPAGKFLSSDERFGAAFAALSASTVGRLREATTIAMNSDDGGTFGRVVLGTKSIQIEIDAEHAQSFRDFFRGALPDLIQQFRQLIPNSPT